MIMAIIDLNPKFFNIKAESQFHFEATIKTGGAAKCVSVPPIETLTNNKAIVAYLSFSEIFSLYIDSSKIIAVTVMEAGSVINDPSKGPIIKAEIKNEIRSLSGK